MTTQNPDYKNTVQSLLCDTWAIMPKYLNAFVERSQRTTFAVDPKSVESFEARAKAIRQVSGRVAVLQLHGVLLQRAGFFETLFFGAQGTDAFGRMFDQVMSNNDIGAIVLDIDSPGGTVAGSMELAQKVFDARGQKPIIAVANSLMASAAYWIGSAADQIVATPSAQVGSIGVVASHVSREKNE